MKLFLTGVPGIGKTTVIRSVINSLQDIPCAGFTTEEIRKGAERIGFRILTLDGREGTLASVGQAKGPRVGRYVVHVKEFENLTLSTIDPEKTPAALYVIDEIGKMELYSESFQQIVRGLLDRPVHLLATIAKKGSGLIEAIKQDKTIEIVEVTRNNWDRLPAELAARIRKELTPHPNHEGAHHSSR